MSQVREATFSIFPSFNLSAVSVVQMKSYFYCAVNDGFVRETDTQSNLRNGRSKPKLTELLHRSECRPRSAPATTMAEGFAV